MQNYTDNQGQEWSIELNGWTIKRVRDNAGVLLTGLMDDNAKLYSQLYSDPILLADIVWPLIEEQAKERSVTLRQFAESFSGEVIGHARDAVVEATLDFFDDPEVRHRTREVIEKIQRIAKQLRASATEKLQEINAEEAAQNYMASSSSWPASVE